MLTCNGYKMFHGTVRVSPVTKEPYDLTGTWLYKPEVDIWYCAPDNGGWTRSLSQTILSDFRDDCAG